MEETATASHDRDPVVHGHAAHLEHTGGGHGHEHGAALQQVAGHVRAEAGGHLLPQVAAVDVGGALGDVALELEVVRVALLLRHGEVPVAVCQNVTPPLPLEVVQHIGQ